MMRKKLLGAALTTTLIAAPLGILGVLALESVSADWGGGGGGGGGGGNDNCGFIFEDSVTVQQAKGAYTAIKDVRVCFDPNCTGDNGGDWGGNDDDDTCNDPCDPFPDDGLFTYVYRLSNAPDSMIGLNGFEVLTEGFSVLGTGSLGGAGVEPSGIEVLTNRVIFQFFKPSIAPGQSSVEVYIISDLGPDYTGASVLGQSSLDTPTQCVGPVVTCEFCDDEGSSGHYDGHDGWGGDDDGSQDGDRCYECPEGLAHDVGGGCPDDDDDGHHGGGGWWWWWW